MKTTILLLLLMLSVAFANAKDKKDKDAIPSFSVSEHDLDVLAKLKAQIEVNNARLDTLQAAAQPILADGRAKQGKLDEIVKRIKDEYEAEHPGFILNYNIQDGESGKFTTAVKPPDPPKSEEKPAPKEEKK